MPRLASNCHGMPRIAHLQLVAADVVDDEDVERHGEEYDAGDANDLEGLVGETFENTSLKLNVQNIMEIFSAPD